MFLFQLCILKHIISRLKLYLERADGPGVTTYLLAHILKFLNGLRVLTLPKQCDDDVASILGINCPKLESVVLTGTGVTNVGLSWLLCCRNLHTIIMPGQLTYFYLSHVGSLHQHAQHDHGKLKKIGISHTI